MAKSKPSHGPSQWLTRPLAGSNGSLGHWTVHSANGRVNPSATKAVHSAIGRVNLPAVHSANGRVNLSRPKPFTRPMAE